MNGRLAPRMGLLLCLAGGVSLLALLFGSPGLATAAAQPHPPIVCPDGPGRPLPEGTFTLPLPPGDVDTLPEVATVLTQLGFRVSPCEPVTAEYLAKVNGLAPPYTVEPGQQLRYRAPSSQPTTTAPPSDTTQTKADERATSTEPEPEAQRVGESPNLKWVLLIIGPLVSLLAVTGLIRSATRRRRTKAMVDSDAPTIPIAVPVVTSGLWLGVAVAVIHAANGGIEPNWGPHLPFLQEHRLGIGDTLMGVAMAGMAIGLWLAAAAGGRLVSRYGSRRVLWPARLGFFGLLWLFAYVAEWWQLFLLTAAIGFSNGLYDVVQGSQGTAFEQGRGKRWNMAFAASFSIASVIAALTALLVRGLHIPIFWHLAGVGLVAYVLTAWASRRLPDLRDEAGGKGRDDDGGRPPSLWPTRMYGLAALAALMPLGAAYTWSTTHLERELHAPDWIVGGGLFAFTLTQAVVQLAAFWFSDRIKPHWQVLAGGLCALAGTALLTSSARVDLAVAGWALVGIGFAPIASLSQSVASERASRGRIRAVALVTKYSYTGLVASPVVIGVVSGGTSLVTSLALMIGLCAAATIVLSVAFRPVRTVDSEVGRLLWRLDPRVDGPAVVARALADLALLLDKLPRAATERAAADLLAVEAGDLDGARAGQLALAIGFKLGAPMGRAEVTREGSDLVVTTGHGRKRTIVRIDIDGHLTRLAQGRRPGWPSIVDDMATAGWSEPPFMTERGWRAGLRAVEYVLASERPASVRPIDHAPFVARLVATDGVGVDDLRQVARHPYGGAQEALERCGRQQLAALFLLGGTVSSRTWTPWLPVQVGVLGREVHLLGDGCVPNHAWERTMARRTAP